MNLTVVSATFFVGLALIVIAIFGGGVEVKEIKIPSLGRFNRFLCFALGSALLGLCILKPELLAPVSSEASATQTSASREASKAANENASAKASVRNILFADDLGSNQESEDIEIFVEGQKIGEFHLDSDTPSAVVPYRTTGATISYFVKGTQVENVEGTKKTLHLSGGGLLKDVEDGNRFDLGTKPGNTLSFD
jgi:hypothetical protein